jgi:hypothetical protein
MVRYKLYKSFKVYQENVPAPIAVHLDESTRVLVHLDDPRPYANVIAGDKELIWCAEVDALHHYLEYGLES